jgi:hypothetical protein
MLDAGAVVLGRDRQRLPALLKEAAERLAPLPEPFTSDFGVHRWLAGSREEAYSDWLAWIVERLSWAQLSFLLGISDADLLLRCDGLDGRIAREQPVRLPTGDIGRLDVLARYGEAATVSVELKLTSPEKADLGSFETYATWLESTARGSHVRKVLIALQGEAESYAGGYELVPWPTIAIRLRRLVPQLLRVRGITEAALSLGFVAAIEQSLLRLPGSVHHLAATILSPWRVTSAIHHLDTWLSEADFDG